MSAGAPRRVDLERLNPEQRLAVEHFEGPLLVLAGAGSGKTRVLTSRIAYLIEAYGVAPESILALTFTNRAAGEMRERVRALLGREPAGMWIGTFHAIGARLLRRDGHRLGLAPNFVIYDAEDTERLVRRILKDELKLDPKRWPPRTVRGAISSAKNELVLAEEYAAQALDPFSRVVAQVFGRYQEMLRAANAVDFDDLLVGPVRLLADFPDLQRRYRQRFRFLLVDEYQDTNRAQYEFLKLLVGPAPTGGGMGSVRNLFVVGDDDQSIYGWRGADIRNILDFEKDFPETGIVRLEENYRSTQRILEAANRVIAENVRRTGKVLRTANAAGRPVILLEAADDADEAQWIAEEIVARIGSDPERTPRDFVVLYRTNAQSRSLEEAFRREGLPYRIIGGQRFYERREIRDLLAYLRLIANPADDESFLRVVNVPRRGVGESSLAHLLGAARAEGRTLLAAAASSAEGGPIRGPAVRALPAFAALIESYAARATLGIPLETLIRELLDEIDFFESLRQEGVEGEDRIANVEELITGAAELELRVQEGDPMLLAEFEEGEAAEVRSLDLFLAHVALVTEIDQHHPESSAATLMTIHNAKGLEFPIVFVAGLEEGLFPLARAHDEVEELEEERRLFYVALTRAREELVLTTARRRRRAGEWMDSVPSSFLESLPRELLELRHTERVRERITPRFGFAGRDSVPGRRERLGWHRPELAPMGDPVVDYSESGEGVRLIRGARVRHPQFGSGSVLSVSGFGNDLRATIDFDTIGRKQVVVRYAKLEPDWD